MDPRNYNPFAVTDYRQPRNEIDANRQLADTVRQNRQAIRQNTIRQFSRGASAK